MVMIDLGDEKKSLGVISVTCVTKPSLARLSRLRRNNAYNQVRALLIKRSPAIS
jgi:hypothetical protein